VPGALNSVAGTLFNGAEYARGGHRTALFGFFGQHLNNGKSCVGVREGNPHDTKDALHRLAFGAK